jgi:outer membrane protein assembly factor BamA
MRLGLNENNDGHDRNLSLVRPFFSVYEKHSAGLYLRQFELEEKNWFRGKKFAEFDHEGELIRVFGGTALNVREQHRVGRLLFGYHLENNSFDYSNSNIPPLQLPPSRDYSYPFIGYQSVKDEYSKVKNINYLGRTEDLYVGESYEWTLGWSDERLGATQDQLALNAQYSNTLLALPNHLWLASTTLTGYYSFDEKKFENLWWSANTRYHMKQSEKWALFAQLRVDYTDGLTADNQLVLGGENGLRGYDRNYQIGDRSFIFSLEQRYYSDWHPFRLVRVGGAVFFDAGRAWFNSRDNGSNGDTLANIGIGLRFNSSRTQKGSVIHVDLAFPLVKDQYVDDVQFLISAKRAF